MNTTIEERVKKQTERHELTGLQRSEPRVPDDWAVKAATRPLAFAQVREDSRLDAELIGRLPRGADAVIIASGGETAVHLSKLELRSLLLVDMNPAQLALTRLKLHLARNVSLARALPLLGHRLMEPAERQAETTRLLAELELPADTFGPPDQVAAVGPDHAGRYEALFAELRRSMAACQHEIGQLLRENDRKRASAMLDPITAFGSVLDEALSQVMALPNLVCLFGWEATQNRRQPFHRHFAERIRSSVEVAPPAVNPWLWQLLAGVFPPSQSYEWLREELRAVRPGPEIGCVRGMMAEVLAGLAERSVNFVHLSNILDWLTGDQAAECLARAARVLRPGGFVIIRQLNSTLDIPGLCPDLKWEAAWGWDLLARDRSFFYTAIHVGVKT